MIKTGSFAKCDACGFEEGIPTLDHIPGNWFAMHTVAGGRPRVPEVVFHLCSEECVVNWIKGKDVTAG